MPISGRSFSGLRGAGAATASGCLLKLSLQVHTRTTLYVHRTADYFSFKRAKTCRYKQLNTLHRSPPVLLTCRRRQASSKLQEQQRAAQRTAWSPSYLQCYHKPECSKKQQLLTRQNVLGGSKPSPAHVRSCRVTWSSRRGGDRHLREWPSFPAICSKDRTTEGLVINIAARAPLPHKTALSSTCSALCPCRLWRFAVQAMLSCHLLASVPGGLRPVQSFRPALQCSRTTRCASMQAAKRDSVLLGLDFGTSGARAMAIDGRQRPSAHASS